MTAISIRNLSKNFGNKRALDNVSLDIERGEMVALIGASGSGKSTLIRHICGLELGHSGQGKVDVLGSAIQDSGRLTARARQMRRNIGVVFQQFNLVGRLSVLSNVLLGNLGRIPSWRGTLGLFTAEEKRAARDALARVGIPEVAWQRASTLSGGQQQRAAIARTLVQRSDILLADEPIASLDPSSARRVMEILAAVNRDEQITCVVSLHQVEYARRYCPRTVALRNGRIVYDGPSSELTNQMLVELYGANSEELILPEAPVQPVKPKRVVEPRHVPAFA
ncbi:phosphonate ABC transporter ATP-binding protein [Pseudaminobacter sp. 19-2017]|uniref:Phosphonate ABC transporter ATP-binding protein n=1 Tax=Pseudaminobacter soli (ex Zhang et al. 2022) TaxID=2831468 RepID=A0A942E3P6_9HYPH|nr:phosphonate ABC transporter ATP-binding protein [Pseudaminobacter soli]MBS3650558.1 phosphonate ABC transporter ATP-binding protein [Pseudaminobacter soli]